MKILNNKNQREEQGIVIYKFSTKEAYLYVEDTEISKLQEVKLSDYSKLLSPLDLDVVDNLLTIKNGKLLAKIYALIKSSNVVNKYIYNLEEIIEEFFKTSIKIDSPLLNYFKIETDNKKGEEKTMNKVTFGEKPHKKKDDELITPNKLRGKLIEKMKTVKNEDLYAIQSLINQMEQENKDYSYKDITKSYPILNWLVNPKEIVKEKTNLGIINSSKKGINIFINGNERIILEFIATYLPFVIPIAINTKKYREEEKNDKEK